MKHEPIDDHAERKRIFALIDRCEKEEMTSDLIKRSDAIAEIRKARTSDIASYQYAELFINAVCRAPSADRPQEWIPCSERLPKEEGIYLVTATNYIFDTEEIVVGTCYFNIEYGFSNNRKILAWMPLPKPWKGVDDENSSR